jgi:hypothetical protein
MTGLFALTTHVQPSYPAAKPAKKIYPLSKSWPHYTIKSPFCQVFNPHNLILMRFFSHFADFFAGYAVEKRFEVIDDNI